MWTRHWLLLTLLVAAVATLGGAGVNARIDIFGLFRDPTNRALPGYGDERVAKYLLSTRYVPRNFDGVLIGSSMSANWPVGSMQSIRLYNESINGGNMAEEKVMLERVLETPGTKLVVVVVHPYLTSSHDFKTVTLTPREEWGALGSQNLFEAYKQMLKIRFGHEKPKFDPAGTEELDDAAKKLNATVTAMMIPGVEFVVDPIAERQFRDLVGELHERRIPVVFVLPPTAEPIFAPKRDAFAHYAATMLADKTPDDRVLDFSSDDMRELRDPENYTDGVHMRTRTAAKAAAVLDEHIKTWMAEGWLSRSVR